jgi:hypothetical protein
MYGSYQCEKCQRIIDYRKPAGVDFPETITAECEDGKKKKCVFRRYYGNVTLVTDSGGHDGVTYNPSKFTPMNKAYGKFGRSTMFDRDGGVSGGGRLNDSSDWT